ncbi:MAG: hypothetical protein HZB31_09875 [Nitrospirae bacterium]|nr:hypothetical protein [Nitrospirota bacterium]
MSSPLSAISAQLSAISLLMAITLLLVLTAAEAAQGQQTPEKVYVVNDYRYIPTSASDDKDTGLSLCGTRCNALTTDYLNITEVGGWQLMKGVVNRELTLELNSPFLKGQCICIGDEYEVRIDDRYGEDRRRPPRQK